jgi:DNA replication protein DnaC
MRLLHATAGIPKKFQQLALDDYRTINQGQRMAAAVCCAYVDTWPEQCNKGGTLVLTGQTGTGKTHLACAVGNAVMAEHLSTVAFGTLSDYGREIRSTFSRGRGERSELQVMQVLRSVDLLVIDDIAAQDSSDFERKLLFDLIDGRWRDDKATIVTSNLNTQELKKFLGVRAMERLEDRGTVIAFDWSSHRGQQQDLV